ncbi:Cyclin-dependent kinase 11B [Cytospora mali]|uniref:non-specific serine/threonine protein kinase n=1 Tax=Cytospora mali TaxID=578113 RepID=A0A194V0S0_CYTMA|nr:Cyclin-dependent kinase 11B [Valsa mali var. pyri (nom. inval.)]
MVDKTAFLGDFGLAKRASSPLTDDYLPPPLYCAPELLHEGFEPTFKSDMWGFMCIFHVLMTGYHPFCRWSDSGRLGCMTRELGPLPREWEGRYKWPDHYTDEERCTWYDQSRSPEGSLFEDIVDNSREELVGTRERELILEVIHKGLRYQPSQRFTAQQLLDDPSFLELMKIHGIE